MESTSHKSPKHVQLANSNNNIHVVDEIPGFLRVYNDGSVERFSSLVSEVPAGHGCADYNVFSQDMALNARLNTWVRIYIPQTALTTDQSSCKKKKRVLLPIIFYFHGGGFCMGSTAWSTYHAFLCSLCWEAKCVLISVEYRLAPEHRLPVAYEDCWEAIEWVRQQALHPNSPSNCEEARWVQSYGDMCRCFMAGDSAGGNIAHHLALRSAATDVKPLRIVGVILIQPFFGRECIGGRTKSELEATDPGLPLLWTDVFWRLSLPVGANRDHPSCNPFMAATSPPGQPVPNRSFKDLSLPPILLLIADGDVMRDIDLEYYKAMKKARKSIRHVIYKGVGHGFQVLHPRSHRAGELRRHVAEFINRFSSPKL